MLRLCSNDSSVLCRGVTPRRRARGPCGLSLLPPSCGSVASTGVTEVSRFSCMKFLDVPWGLRLRRTDQELALSLPFMLPSAHLYCVGVRVVSFRSSIAHPAYPLSTLHWVPRGSSARLERYFFLVRLLPPLLHAGLSRRTNIPISLTTGF